MKNNKQHIVVHDSEVLVTSQGKTLDKVLESGSSEGGGDKSGSDEPAVIVLNDIAYLVKYVTIKDKNYVYGLSNGFGDNDLGLIAFLEPVTYLLHYLCYNVETKSLYLDSSNIDIWSYNHQHAGYCYMRYKTWRFYEESDWNNIQPILSESIDIPKYTSFKILKDFNDPSFDVPTCNIPICDVITDDNRTGFTLKFYDGTYTIIEVSDAHYIWLGFGWALKTSSKLVFYFDLEKPKLVYFNIPDPDNKLSIAKIEDDTELNYFTMVDSI